ncbi:MAG: hypothetical protein K0S39_3978 [Paenibacillus sp.]|jgi:hypothetical protein|nr:hypothetical protein [Paenibacillus sp.]
MLYIITLIAISTLMLAVLRRNRLSSHSIVTAYSIAVYLCIMLPKRIIGGEFP